MGYFRKMEEKHRLKNLAKKTPGCFAGAYFDKYRGRFIRYYRPRAVKIEAKKLNKAVRRTEVEMSKKGCHYRKVVGNAKWNAF